MFITKKRHEDVKRRLEEIIAENDATIEMLEAEVHRLNKEFDERNEQIADLNAVIKTYADTIRRKGVTPDERATMQAEIERLRPLAQKHLDKLARDRKRVRGGAKVSAKPAMKKASK